jgi:thiol-disulfide isomerase/thioredoxin
VKHIFKGLVVVLILGTFLGLAYWRYHAFLTAGMSPPLGTQKLGELEKNGVPDFTLEDLAGQPVRLSDFKDKTVILSFWASWCDPCVAEFPSMVKLVEFFKGQVVMVAVSADHTKEDIMSFLKPYGGQPPPHVVVLWDKEKTIPELYGTEVLPESFILGRDLKLVRKVAGSEDWFTPGAIELFKEITGQGKPRAD